MGVRDEREELVLGQRDGQGLVRELVGEIYGRCTGDAGEMQGRCGEDDVGEMWWRCGGDVGGVWGDVGEM